MKNYIQIDPWKIIEEGFNPAYNRVSESLFSLGNGKFGQRGNFEETYSGDSLKGNYIGGVYYPDKTRVGWWKNGYPEYFAKVLNAPEWSAVRIQAGETELDLAKANVIHFRRTLDMKNGLLQRSCNFEQNSNHFRLNAERFCSMANHHLGALVYELQNLTYNGTLEIKAIINADVYNEDANYDEQFWLSQEEYAHQSISGVVVSTKITDFYVASFQKVRLWHNGKEVNAPTAVETRDKFTSINFTLEVKEGDQIQLEKLVCNISSLDFKKDGLKAIANDLLLSDSERSYEEHKSEHIGSWNSKWQEADIRISGDDKAQQGIRFNIFQLYQTYTGEDARLNIGPKGFTGEKYGGSTYWDTEAYCLPFYMSTADQSVARNLLLYRYQQLDKAIENAGKLGFDKGAALYPMVTMNGEECHNEWEITFEEIHRNGAIAYAIFNYVRYTGDHGYIQSHGLEVLTGIARFWAQRVNWSKPKQRYVILGVTGPNEFENNVNNNWYTNYLAAWCLKYAAEQWENIELNHKEAFLQLLEKTHCSKEEWKIWQEIAEQMYYPYDEKHKIFLQQDGFLDKEITTVSEIPDSQLPIVEHWSWDRILRSCYIKQADTLQGMYFFEDEFDFETHKRHFDFYEPLTVHESSLSPCVHSILASRLGDEERAYRFYLRTSRLDLDDYNNDTRDGCHITSMAGTWMSITQGFAGMKVVENKLSFSTFLPSQWESFSFKIRFRENLLELTISKAGTAVKNIEGPEIELHINKQLIRIKSNTKWLSTDQKSVA